MPERSMFEALLGDRCATLPAAVQRFHRLSGRVVLHGEVETEASRSWLGRLLARCLGAPVRASRGPLRFELDAQPGLETWTRHFPGRSMRSCLRRTSGGIEEQLGPSRLTFTLIATDDRLSMRLEALSVLGLPCPRCWLPQVIADETGRADRLHFHVRATLPWIGLVAGYRGFLDLPGAPPA